MGISVLPVRECTNVKIIMEPRMVPKGMDVFNGDDVYLPPPRIGTDPHKTHVVVVGGITEYCMSTFDLERMHRICRMEGVPNGIAEATKNLIRQLPWWKRLLNKF